VRWTSDEADLGVYRKLRETMVRREVLEKGIDDERVVEAMRRLPRHLFVDEALWGRAHLDEALPIGWKQTISRPHIVALMSRLLDPAPDDAVLEIGTGSGYQAAVLSFLAGRVDSVERIAGLAERARRVLRFLGIDSVRVFDGDGTVGLPERAPYPRVIVTAGSPDLPEALFEQLAEGGRMVVPVADPEGGERLRVVERRHGRAVVRASVPCAFVPLIGRQGYAEPEPPPEPWP
jgi:protein-L-isoaspartate(D-aspartate) O-methyltransferase